MTLNFECCCFLVAMDFPLDAMEAGVRDCRMLPLMGSHTCGMNNQHGELGWPSTGGRNLECLLMTISSIRLPSGPLLSSCQEVSLGPDFERQSCNGTLCCQETQSRVLANPVRIFSPLRHVVQRRRAANFIAIKCQVWRGSRNAWTFLQGAFPSVCQWISSRRAGRIRLPSALRPKCQQDLQHESEERRRLDPHFPSIR